MKGHILKLLIRIQLWYIRRYIWEIVCTKYAHQVCTLIACLLLLFQLNQIITVSDCNILKITSCNYIGQLFVFFLQLQYYVKKKSKKHSSVYFKYIYLRIKGQTAIFHYWEPPTWREGLEHCDTCRQQELFLNSLWPLNFTCLVVVLFPVKVRGY